MLVDFNQKLKDIDDKDTDQDLKSVCVMVLQGLVSPADAQVEHGKKREWFKLAKRIKKSIEPITIKSEHITLLKERLAMAYGASICGPACELLDPEPEETEEKKESERSE